MRVELRWRVVVEPPSLDAGDHLAHRQDHPARLDELWPDLEKIAISDDADIDAMKGWRRQIFGEDALKLKRGEIALVLNGARVEVVEIE